MSNQSGLCQRKSDGNIYEYVRLSTGSPFIVTLFDLFGEEFEFGVLKKVRVSLGAFLIDEGYIILS